MPSRPLPAPPEPSTANRYPFPSQATLPPRSRSRSFTVASTSSLALSIPPFPPPPITASSSPTSHRSPTLSVAKSRSAFPLSASKTSKATRNATSWSANQKGAAGSMSEGEQKKRKEDPRKAHIQAQVKSSIQSLLSREIPYEWCDTVLKECGQMCRNGGLDLSVVLQEPLIDGKPPIYWAILNGPVTTLQKGEAALHALVLSLLVTCQPLKETTIASIRLACMSTSNNALLQHLFWHFPPLSPLSRSDAMLLSAAGGGDVIDVDQRQDGIGAFVARLQIRRFRLRMRVSKLVKVEFVTSDRIWTITFSLGEWLLSFGLGDHSMPAWVDGDFLVLRRSSSIDSGDDFEPAFSLPLGRNPCKFQPGAGSAITMRLDDGPMRPHLLNESRSLVDSDGTLHAQFNVRLTQPRQPSPPSIGPSDSTSVRPSAQATTKTRLKPARSLIFTSQAKRNRDAPENEKKVYTSLRRGGR
ncbi:hypothetical protein EDB85DRAFT_1915819 [Lactarius pseudohatsudake]|nr:hypothetical protein EDB85DRAFT_1915819 [Lactarius pseudohatsudake]